jgi:hypothetical protein
MSQPEHGPALELGSATIGAWTVRAAREDGALAAGGEAPVDLWVTGGTGQPAAVRIWIGTETGAESVKQRANVESSDDPTHYHAHAEAPTPIPDGSLLWVELEDESGAKTAGSFDLKR